MLYWRGSCQSQVSPPFVTSQALYFQKDLYGDSYALFPESDFLKVCVCVKRTQASLHTQANGQADPLRRCNEGCVCQRVWLNEYADTGVSDRPLKISGGLDAIRLFSPHNLCVQLILHTLSNQSGPFYSRINWKSKIWITRGCTNKHKRLFLIILTVQNYQHLHNYFLWQRLHLNRQYAFVPIKQTNKTK